MHRALAAGVAVLALMLPRPANAIPGALDHSFSRNGVQTAFHRGGTANAVAIDDQDRIVVAGAATRGGSDVAIARFRAGGALDPTFGGDGMVRVDLGGADEALDVDVAPDGSIVAVGHRRTATRTAWFALRLRADGRPDDTFGGDGVVVTDFGRRFEGADAVAVMDDGAVLVAGGVSDGLKEQWAFVRYLEDGSLDDTFGGDGRVLLSLSRSAEQPQDLVLTANGILAAGYADRNFRPRFAVA